MSSKYIPLGSLPPAEENGSTISEGELPSYKTGAPVAQQTESPDSILPPKTTTFTVIPRFFGGEKGKFTIFRLGFAVERGFDEFKTLLKRKLDSTPGLPPGLSDDFILGYYYYDYTFVIVNTNEDLASIENGMFFHTLVCLRSDHLHLLEKQSKMNLITVYSMLILSYLAFIFYMAITEFKETS